MNVKKYRDIIDGDVIQVGDKWYNPAWETGGPWFTVNEGNKQIGTTYVSDTCRPMRRPI